MSNAAVLTTLFEQALQLDRAASREKWKADHPQGKVGAYISDAGKCPRQTWYSLTDAPESNPPGLDSLVNFAVGRAVENELARIFEQAGIPVVREARVEVPWGEALISGRADYLFVMPALNCIAELKTSKFRAVRKGIATQGDEFHRAQLRGYMLAGKLGLLKEYGILPEHCDYGVLAYVVKDATKGQQVFYAYDVDFDWAEIEKSFDALEVASLSREQTIPPARPRGFQKGKFPCAWCNWEDFCWTDLR